MFVCIVFLNFYFMQFQFYVFCVNLFYMGGGVVDSFSDGLGIIVLQFIILVVVNSILVVKIFQDIGCLIEIYNFLIKLYFFC